MKQVLIFSLIVYVFCQVISAQGKILPKNKLQLIQTIERHKLELTTASDQIWHAAETALEEYRSSDILAKLAEKHGFKVERGVANIPTAFTATYGSGGPVIGILGEFDALPGLSQKTIATKEALVKGGAGHGCGHNLFGVGSLAAAIAIKELIERGEIKGTIKFFATPAEETIFAKVFMARAKVFDGVDIMMDWHPSRKIEANMQSSKALVDFRVSFFGKTAHASADPWNGRSAADALEFYTAGLNYYREHIKPTARIHYLVEKAGEVVNVVPDEALIWTRIRENNRQDLDVMYNRIQKIAKGAALMAEVDYKIQLISGIYEILVIDTGAKIMQKNLELLGPISFTKQEIQFAKDIQKATGKPQLGLDGNIYPLKETQPAQGGSTDIGDVSQIVPTIRMSATVAAKGAPWHAWPVVATSGMSIGHKGMLYAANAMSMSMLDLYQNPKLRKAIKQEFSKKQKGKKYKPNIPKGPPPFPQ